MPPTDVRSEKPRRRRPRYLYVCYIRRTSTDAVTPSLRDARGAHLAEEDLSGKAATCRRRWACGEQTSRAVGPSATQVRALGKDVSVVNVSILIRGRLQGRRGTSELQRAGKDRGAARTGLHVVGGGHRPCSHPPLSGGAAAGSRRVSARLMDEARPAHEGAQLALEEKAREVDLRHGSVWRRVKAVRSNEMQLGPRRADASEARMRATLQGATHSGCWHGRKRQAIVARRVIVRAWHREGAGNGPRLLLLTSAGPSTGSSVSSLRAAAGHTI